MTAAVLYGKEDLRLEQVALPVPAQGEVVLRVGAALTCGTDLKVYRRGYHAMMLTPPVPFGHEVSGTVSAVGAGVALIREGDRVVALNSAPCDQCFWCGKGQHNLCENLLFNNGAYAQYLRVPERIVQKNTLIIPGDTPFACAALTEPLACVVRGFEESGAQPGDSMAVIGAGPIGLMFMHVAALHGVRVVAVVKRPDQEAAARLFGASDVVRVDFGVDAVRAVRSLTPKERGVDIAIEAVATPGTWEQAVAMVRRGGVVNFFGGPPSGTAVALDTNRLHYGDITLKASFHHTPAACRKAFDLITRGRFQCSNYITGQAGLCDVPEVFRRMVIRREHHSNMEEQSEAEPITEIKTAVLPEGDSF